MGKGNRNHQQRNQAAPPAQTSAAEAAKKASVPALEKTTSPTPEQSKEKLLGVVVHQASVKNTPKQFLMKGIMRDVEQKLLTLLADVDENTSIAIGLTLVPTSFEFPQEEKTENVQKNNSDAELRKLSDANSGQAVNGAGVQREQPDKNTTDNPEGKIGTGITDAGSETEKTLKLHNAPDPFAHIRK